jgi:hypothetical protein
MKRIPLRMNAVGFQPNLLHLLEYLIGRGAHPDASRLLNAALNRRAILRPLPLGEGRGEGKSECVRIGRARHFRFPLTLTLSRREREQEQARSRRYLTD